MTIDTAAAAAEAPISAEGVVTDQSYWDRGSPALRPSHVTAPAHSEDWFLQCDHAFQARMLALYPRLYMSRPDVDAQPATIVRRRA